MLIRNNIQWSPIRQNKLVNQYTLNKVLVKTWDSLHQVAKELQLNLSYLSRQCRRGGGEYRSYWWEFTN